MNMQDLKFWLVKNVAQEFAIEGDIVHMEENSNGHINNTYILTTMGGGGKAMMKRYVLQRINDKILKDPVQVMENIHKVLYHIHRKMRSLQQDPEIYDTKKDEKLLRLIPLKSDEHSTYVRRVYDDSGTWRCYNFIEGCVTYNVVETITQAYTVAHAFGSFQELLGDISIDCIHETIPDFHNTPKRFQRLLEVVHSDPFDRVKSVIPEISFVKARRPKLSIITNLCESGNVPVRLTHNDTKINNILIDKDTNKAICVIDLDTVMPGSSLYDFGDLIRTVVSPSEEDELDLRKIVFRMPIYEALVDGYTDASQSLCQDEIRYLAFSGILMTLEVGMRFLTDYLEGDVYFKSSRPSHNLDRARAQFRLVELLEDNQSRMEDYLQQKMKHRS